MKRLPTRRAQTATLGLAALLAATSVGSSTAAHADAPPSDHIYSRAQTWTCPGLGVFTALYSPWGNMAHVKWLSITGSRDTAVQITLVSGDITLTIGGETYHFVGPENPPARNGQEQFECSVYAASEDGQDSINGTAVVAVIPRTSLQ